MGRTNPRTVEQIEEFNKRPFKPAKIIEGKNVKIHPTATLGGDGFTWARKDDGGFLQAHNLGDIILEDDVKIGAHCDIKRSTLPETATVIGNGSVLISYVNVGHNCKIGKNNWLGPHVCLNGSVQIGDGCWIAAHAVLHQGVKIGDGATVGMGAIVRNDVPAGETVVNNHGVAVPIKFVGNQVHPSFKHGKNFKIGKYNIIHEGVTVGNNVTLGSFNEFTDTNIGNNVTIGSYNELIGTQIGNGVTIKSKTELRKNTTIGDRCDIDSGVETSGDCRIGNDVTLRFASIIARGVEIEDNVFISPQFMSENLNHKGEAIGGAHIGTREWDHETKYRAFIGTNVTLAAGIEICSGTIIGSKTNVRKSILKPGTFIGNPARRLKV